MKTPTSLLSYKYSIKRTRRSFSVNEKDTKYLFFDIIMFNYFLWYFLLCQFFAWYSNEKLCFFVKHWCILQYDHILLWNNIKRKNVKIFPIFRPPILWGKCQKFHFPHSMINGCKKNVHNICFFKKIFLFFGKKSIFKVDYQSFYL